VTKGRRADNRYVPERTEHQKISIARDNELRVAVKRQFQKLIVFWIAAFRHTLVDRDRLSGTEYSPRARIEKRQDTRADARPSQAVEQFLSRAGVFSNPSNLSTHRTTMPGHDDSLNAALTKTLE
jgi:hypothetical protein